MACKEPTVDDVIIFDNVTITNEALTNLINTSTLTKDDLVNRIRQVYTQTSKPIDEIINKLQENEYNVLETIKSFFKTIINQPVEKTKSINQFRMKEIRNYMNEREKIRQTTKKSTN